MNEERFVVILVNGAKNEDEQRKAYSIALKARRQCNRWFVNPIFTPVYNRIWKILKPNYTAEERLDENGAYTRLYVGILNQVAKAFVLLNGGYWFSEKRKVCLRYDNHIKPGDEYARATYVIDDMIYIKDFKD